MKWIKKLKNKFCEHREIDCYIEYISDYSQRKHQKCRHCKKEREILSSCGVVVKGEWHEKEFN